MTSRHKIPDLKVLVIDDDQHIREALSTLLRRQHFDVEIAGNGQFHRFNIRTAIAAIHQIRQVQDCLEHDLPGFWSKIC